MDSILAITERYKIGTGIEGYIGLANMNATQIQHQEFIKYLYLFSCSIIKVNWPVNGLVQGMAFFEKKNTEMDLSKYHTSILKRLHLSIKIKYIK